MGLKPPPHASVALFALAGIYTESGFMEPLNQALSASLLERGIDVKSALLYPYGDWTRRLAVQLSALVRDMLDIRERFWSAIGARAARGSILRAAEAGRTILLVGHSGGGVAALQIAGQLIKAGFASPLVVQIGSPKCPVPDGLKDRVLYLYGTDQKGKCKDPVARLGRWGGWIRSGRPSVYRRDAHAPDRVVGIPLAGGHPDYFRAFPPFVDQDGITNLEHTLRPLLSWLDHELHVK